MGFRPDEAELRRWVEKGLVPASAVGLPAPPAPVDDATAEKQFQAEVIKEAKRRGWRCFHVHDSRKSEAGWPDLVLVRDRVVFAELKSEGGRLTADQKTWVELLGGAGAEVYVWRPSSWPEIMRVLA